MGAGVLPRRAGTSMMAGAKARLLVVALAVVALLALAPAANAAITSVFTATPNPIPCAVQGNGVRLCDQTIAGNPGGTARSTDQDLRRRADRRARRVSARAGERPGRSLPADHDVPRLRGHEAFAREHAAVPQCRLRDLQHDHARLRPVVRQRRIAVGRPERLCRRPRAPDGHALRGPRRAGARRAAGRRGTHVSRADRCDRRLLRRRHVDGARGAQEPQDAAGRLARRLAEPERHADADRGRDAGDPVDRPRVLADAQRREPSTTSPTRPTWAAPASSSPRARTRSTTRASRWASTRRPVPIRTPTCATGTSTFNNGEPYDDANGNPLPAFADIQDELTTHHSSYYIDHSQPPAPLLISNGFTDDLFPADEAIRYYNRTKSEYPGAAISLFFGSFGHQRGQNKADALAARARAGARVVQLLRAGQSARCRSRA